MTRYFDKSYFSNKSGIALLMTLWVLVLLSVVAMSFAFSTRWSSASARNFKEETKAYYLALSGYEEALANLLSAKNQLVFTDADGNFYTDKDSKPVTGKVSTDEGDVEVKITDEESKVNVNIAGDARLKALLDYAGVPSDSEQEVIDSIMDWISPGAGHRLSGAGDEYYESLDIPYKAKRRPVDSIEELLLVKGFKPEYLYGSEEIKPLYNLITFVGDGNININTVSKEVLEIIGLNELDIETVFKQRTQEFGGFTQTPNFMTRGFNFKTASSYFRFEVTAGLKGSKQVMKITSIVKRIAAPKGFDFQTVYWRESVESRRT